MWQLITYKIHDVQSDDKFSGKVKIPDAKGREISLLEVLRNEVLQNIMFNVLNSHYGNHPEFWAIISESCLRCFGGACAPLSIFRACVNTFDPHVKPMR